MRLPLAVLAVFALIAVAVVACRPEASTVPLGEGPLVAAWEKRVALASAKAEPDDDDEPPPTVPEPL